MENTKEKKGLSVSAKSFITAIAIIFGVMVLCYVLTFIIPAGQFQREELADGTQKIIDGTYSQIGDVKFSFWQWIASPILVLNPNYTLSVLFVVIFLLVIGGIFGCLNKCGIMQYMIDKITAKFGHKKYLLLAIITLFFMAMGSLIGSFEEVVPLVPIIVALSINLGWDVLTGLGMSLLAVSSGFASGVCNPFTVGVAQTCAGLPMFSGIWLRLVSFVLIYALLFSFLYLYAKRVDTKSGQQVLLNINFIPDKKFDRAVLSFAVILGIGIAIVFASAFIKAIQGITMVIIALMFLIAGATACFVSGMELKPFLSKFKDGLIEMLPAVLLVLIASSIKYILEKSMILDTILFGVVKVASSMPKWTLILFIYLFVLIMNFFIGSGSAKAAMLIPLIVPVANLFGISPQLCVLAFAFGDGFSNVFYPTNPVLLISLGLTETGYGKWVKYSWKFQVLNLLLTCGLLLFGLAVGY
ncbi:MAG: AbgT family transporter [Clostridia bacterium]|nr:AbgT family transporter [Clostridia bacterium]